MAIPYRVRRTLQRVGLVALVVALIALVIWLCWMLWLGRFVIYTRNNGAQLDFSNSSLNIAGQPATEPPQQETVPIYYNEGENQLNVSKELVQMVGYYVTQQDLETDIAAIRPQLQKLEKSTPVMIDVKSYKGDFFYSSTLSDNRNSKIDPAAMDELLEYLQLSDMYAIARLPGLRDFNYGLNHVSDGLPTAGGYLWMDDDRCYWLNPSSQGTITYLVSIITELKSLGFDEVVFEDFRFPDTTQIVFKNDRAEALTAAAQLLVDTCTGDNFAVSFVGAHDFPLPTGRSRLYVTGATAADAASVASQTGLENPAVNLVFLTDLHDTRFDVYSVLRPLSGAH